MLAELLAQTADGDRTKPQSLGVINASAEIPISQIGPSTAEYFGGITLAISLEPEGGSSTWSTDRPGALYWKICGTVSGLSHMNKSFNPTP